jgi:hypothetical protein
MAVRVSFANGGPQYERQVPSYELWKQLEEAFAAGEYSYQTANWAGRLWRVGAGVVREPLDERLRGALIVVGSTVLDRRTRYRARVVTALAYGKLNQGYEFTSDAGYYLTATSNDRGPLLPPAECSPLSDIIARTALNAEMTSIAVAEVEEGRLLVARNNPRVALAAN